MNLDVIKAIKKITEYFEVNPTSYSKGCFCWTRYELQLLLSVGARIEIHLYRPHPGDMFSCVFVYDGDKNRGFFQEMFEDEPVSFLSDEFHSIVNCAIGKLTFDQWIDAIVEILPYFASELA